MLYIGQLRCHFSKWVVTTNITFSEKNKKHRIWPLEPELFKKQTLKTLRQREVSHFQQNMSRCRPKFACFWSQFSRLENWVRLFLPVLSYQQRLNNVLNVSWQPKCTCLFENVACPRLWLQNSAFCCKSTLMFTVCFVSLKQNPNTDSTLDKPHWVTPTR